MTKRKIFYILISIIFICTISLSGYKYFYKQNIAFDEKITDTSERKIKKDTRPGENTKKIVGKIKYKITEGYTSYNAQKVWFGKPLETVVGSTNKIWGTGWFNPATGAGFVQAEADLSFLHSGSKGRDEHIPDIFVNSTDAAIKVNLNSSEIELGEGFTKTIPATVTINDVTRDLKIKVSGIVTDEDINIFGESETFMIEDFDLVALSYVGMFSVGQKASFNFEVEGRAVN